MQLAVNQGNQFAGGFLVAVGKLFQQRSYVGRDGLHSAPPELFYLRQFASGRYCTRFLLVEADQIFSQWTLFPRNDALRNRRALELWEEAVLAKAPKFSSMGEIP